MSCEYCPKNGGGCIVCLAGALGEPLPTLEPSEGEVVLEISEEEDQ